MKLVMSRFYKQIDISLLIRHPPSFVSQEKIVFVAMKFSRIWMCTIYWHEIEISAKLQSPCLHHFDFNRTQVIWYYFIKLAFTNVMQGFIVWFAAGRNGAKEIEHLFCACKSLWKFSVQLQTHTENWISLHYNCFVLQPFGRYIIFGDADTRLLCLQRREVIRTWQNE